MKRKAYCSKCKYDFDEDLYYYMKRNNDRAEDYYPYDSCDKKSIVNYETIEESYEYPKHIYKKEKHIKRSIKNENNDCKDFRKTIKWHIIDFFNFIFRLNGDH